MQDPLGYLIPRGVIETYTAEIADQVVVWYFKDRRITKKFVESEIKAAEDRGKEINVMYVERTGKAITKYEGKEKEEIRDHILTQLKKIGVNAKRIKEKRKNA